MEPRKLKLGIKSRTPAESLSRPENVKSITINISLAPKTLSGNLKHARGRRNRSMSDNESNEMVDEPPCGNDTDMRYTSDEGKSSREGLPITNGLRRCNLDGTVLQAESFHERKSECHLEKKRASYGRHPGNISTAQAVQTNTKIAHRNDVSHKDFHAGSDAENESAKHQASKSELEQADMIVKSVQKCKKLLSPDAKEFKPVCVIPTQPLPDAHRKLVPRAPYFLSREKYDASRSQATLGMTLCMPNLYMSYTSKSKNRPIAKPGYWFDEGNGTIIPGLDCYPPKALETEGLILPVWWLPV